MSIKKIKVTGIDGFSGEDFKKDEDVIANKVSVKTVSATADVSLAWDVVLIDSSAGAVVLTLPEPTFSATVSFKTIDGTNLVTIGTAGTSQIDGSDTLVITATNDTAILAWSPVEEEWYIVSSNIAA